MVCNSGRLEVFGTVVGWPFLMEGMKGAEEAVQPREHGSVVPVDGAVESVMPVVKGRRGEQPFQWSEAPGDVGVDVKAP